MFARSVSMRLKPKTVADFNQTLENEVLPILRQRNGFQEELVLVTPDGTGAIAISLWDNKENAEEYHRSTFPEVQKLLSKVIDGTPRVQNYDVPIASFHKVAVRRGGGSRSGD